MIVVNPGPLSRLGVPIGRSNVRFDKDVPTYLDDGYRPQLSSLGLVEYASGMVTAPCNSPILVQIGGPLSACLASIPVLDRIARSHPSTRIQVICPAWLTPLIHVGSVTKDRPKEAYRTFTLGPVYNKELWDSVQTRLQRWELLAMHQAGYLPDPTADGWIAPAVEFASGVLILSHGSDHSVTVPGLGAAIASALHACEVCNEVPRPDTLENAPAPHRLVIACGDSPWTYYYLQRGSEVWAVSPSRWIVNNEKQYAPFKGYKKLSAAGHESYEDWGRSIAKDISTYLKDNTFHVEIVDKPEENPYAYIPETPETPDSDETPALTQAELDALHELNAPTPHRRWGRG